jgi:hypothetical protein
MLDLRAYCDESVTADRQPPTLCIAGYVAAAATWAEFEREWKAALAKESLTEFHMALCENGKGEYAGRGRAERDRIWRVFFDILTSARIVGFGTVIDLDAYADLAHVFKAKRQPGFDDPYHLAFQHQVEMMALRMAEMRRTERILMVFDESHLEDNAARLYSSLKKSRTLPYVARLGGLAFEDSKLIPGLQAADILAYELRRHFWEGVFPASPKPAREQWRILAARGLNVNYFDAGALAKLADLLQ